MRGFARFTVGALFICLVAYVVVVGARRGDFTHTALDSLGSTVAAVAEPTSITDNSYEATAVRRWTFGPNEFVVVTFKAMNHGDSPMTIATADFHLTRGSDTYDAVDAPTFLAPKFSDTINPGLSAYENVAFPVAGHLAADKFSLVTPDGGTIDL